MEDTFLKRIAQIAVTRLEEKLQFGELLVTSNKENERQPFPGQIMRIYEMVENDTKRILFADATGFGKTYVAALILGLLNQRKRRTHKCLVIAPQQSLETAWTEEELNSYVQGLGLQNGRMLKVAQLDRNNSESILLGSDVIGVNYHKFNCATAERYVNRVLDIATNLDLIVFDESQNYRSFRKRGTNLKRLLERTKNKRVLLLSATPGHNGLEDLGIPLHILDSKHFSYAPYDYNTNPTAIKDMILSGQWFYSDRDVVQQLFELPSLTIHEPMYVDLGIKHAHRYLSIWRNGDLDIGSKIALLRKHLLLGKLESGEGRRGLETILESFPREDAIVVFTHLKTGVSENIFSFLEQIYGRRKVAMINGDVRNVKKRVETALRFRDGEYKVIANSLLTMSEGVPCVAGERNVHVVFLEMPMNQGQLNQAIGRVYRKGQKGGVHIRTLLGENKWLSNEMTRLVESGELEEKYLVTFPRSWRPTLIDYDIHEIMRKKEQLYREKVIHAIRLDDRELATMMYNEYSPNRVEKVIKTGMLNIPKKIKEKESPMSLFTRFGGVMYGMGEHEGYEASLGHGTFNLESKLMTKAYIDRRIFLTSAGDTARLLKKIVERLERKGVSLNNLLDLGCGTGVVSRVLGRSMINLDYDARMLDTCGLNGFGIGPRVQGFMTCLPFRNDQFDLVSASYSIFYNRQEGNRREIEKIFMEMNRVLRDQGYALISLTRTTKQRDVNTIGEIMNAYGFNVLLNDFFVGYGTDKRNSRFLGAYVLLAQKGPAQEDYVKGSFTVYESTRYSVSRGQTKKVYGKSPKKIKRFRPIYSESFCNREKVPLQQLLRRRGI